MATNPRYYSLRKPVVEGEPNTDDGFLYVSEPSGRNYVFDSEMVVKTFKEIRKTVPTIQIHLLTDEEVCVANIVSS